MLFDKKNGYANKVENEGKLKLKSMIYTFYMMMNKLGEEKEKMLKGTAFGSLLEIKLHDVRADLVFTLIPKF